ncbi:hypothetical protein IJG27_00110 [Candidatus Saccharibacteria bacterium]|nr:hypothetical protein [Candidatus Saccharibacteria bacterium]
MGLRSGAGGGVRPMVVLGGTACFTMVVAYIPATTPAAVGSMCDALVKKRL